MKTHGVIHERPPLRPPLGFAACTLSLLLAGCAEDPNCTVTGVIGGDVSGELAWVGVGHDECSLFLDRVDFYKNGDHLYFDGLGSDFELKVGTYDDMLVGFSTPDQSWSSSDCVVALDSVVREDWTRNDYYLIAGRIACPPLDNGNSTIDLQGVTFAGYLVEEF